MTGEVVRRLTVLREAGRPAIEPPAKGEPCNRCGHCCMEATCSLGQAVLGVGGEGPCPLLRVSAFDYACGLIVDSRPHDIVPTRAVASAEARYFNQIVQLRMTYDGLSLAEQARTMLGVGRGCDADFIEAGGKEGA